MYGRTRSRSYYSRRGTYSSGGKGFYRKYGGSVGRAIGGFKAQKSGVKTFYLTTTTQNSGSLTFSDSASVIGPVVLTSGGNHDWAANFTNIPVNTGPQNDITFRAMCHMFDQCKCLGMRVTMRWYAPSANPTAPCEIHSVWDRMTLASECGMNASAAMNKLPSVSDIIGNASTQVTNLGNYSKNCVYRSVYARDAQERSNWFDCSLVYDSTVGYSPLRICQFNTWHDSHTWNCFMPSLFFALKRPQTGLSETWTFSIKIDYMFTFRNMVSKLRDFAILNTPGYVNPMSKAKKTEEPPTMSVVRIIEGDEDDEKVEDVD